MLEPPNIPAVQIAGCLHAAYGLSIREISFLPLGADVNSAAYRVVARNGTAYFLKLRRGHVPEATLAIPHWLRGAGVEQVIPPLANRTTGALSTRLDSFTAILHPFVAGRSGWDVELSHRHWIELGRTLRTLHASAAPPAYTDRLPRETYSAEWRDRVAADLQQLPGRSFTDPVAQELAQQLQARRDLIERILTRAEHLARVLATQRQEWCLCHGDIHAGNVLIDTENRLYLVDWDTLVLAPKERDLMFVGGGVGGIWNDDRETAWFYEGYGPTQIHPEALTYYRYERIVQDIAEINRELLHSDRGGSDRAVMLEQFTRQFQPGNVVDVALSTDLSFLKFRQ